MTKNTLGDVHVSLMEQLQRLMDAEPGSDEMAQEIKRSKAASDLGLTIVANANTIMRASNMANRNTAQVPKILTSGE